MILINGEVVNRLLLLNGSNRLDCTPAAADRFEQFPGTKIRRLYPVACVVRAALDPEWMPDRRPQQLFLACNMQLNELTLMARDERGDRLQLCLARLAGGPVIRSESLICVPR